MAYKPRIGLTMRLEEDTRRFYLGRDYSEALEACGALPVHIPLIPHSEYIFEIMSGLDGVLLPGSDTDIDPAYYGEDPHPKIGKTIPEKDETDLMVLEATETMNIPVLAICFGMQALNVSRGGSLIQDISAQSDSPMKHEQERPLERNSHFIRVGVESHFYAENSEYCGSKVKVNSHHHQAIHKIGKNLAVAALAGDGIIEAIEDTRTDRYVIGVQWHPELSWKTDKLSRAVFVNFVQACCGTTERGNSRDIDQIAVRKLSIQKS